jgi:hypothetical protein
MSVSRASTDQPGGVEDRRRRRVTLAQWEADLAYFQARLEIVGDPETTSQVAERKVFALLSKVVGEEIVRGKRRMMDE